MADIVLTGDTSGSITVAAPAVAGTNTLTLPANTGTLMTSTYTSGDVDIDSGTLHVDATNNRVGIGTSSPATPLEVVGAVNSTYFTGGSDTISGRQLTLSCESQGGNDNATHRLTVPSGYGNFAVSVAGSERMRIDSSGNVLIGNTSVIGSGVPSSIVAGVQTEGVGRTSYSRGTGTGGFSHLSFINGNGYVGTVVTSGSATSYNTSSDYRLKEDWQPMSGSIDRLKNLNPVNFAWKADGSRVDGFLAHEAQEVVPESVHGTKDAMRTEEYEVTPAVLDDDDNVVTEAVMGTREVPDYQGIDQSKLVPLLTAALQEAVTKIEDLETRIQALENA